MLRFLDENKPAQLKSDQANKWSHIKPDWHILQKCGVQGASTYLHYPYNFAALTN